MLRTHSKYETQSPGSYWNVTETDPVHRAKLKWQRDPKNSFYSCEKIHFKQAKCMLIFRRKGRVYLMSLIPMHCRRKGKVYLTFLVSVHFSRLMLCLLLSHIFKSSNSIKVAKRKQKPLFQTSREVIDTYSKPDKEPDWQDHIKHNSL